MATAVAVAPATHADEADWRRMWVAYCRFYGVDIAQDVTDDVWRRISSTHSPVRCFIARLEGAVVGFCNIVVHEYTWGTQPICYLEDLFTEPHARGRGVGGALIRHLAELGRGQWDRVYWVTKHDNATARALYDRVCGGADGFVRYTLAVEKK